MDRESGGVGLYALACDVCAGIGLGLVCYDRDVYVCARCLVIPGRLGAVDHWMPGRTLICVHRRADALAIKRGAGNSVLYQVGN